MTNNIPEHNILQLLNKMEILEKKMTDTAEYLSLYNELKDMEAKFLEAVGNVEERSYELSEAVKKRIKLRNDKILKKRQ